MKRGTFKVCVNARAYPPPSPERTGYYDDLFGIHGNKFGWTITHLTSGLICGEAANAREAREKCAAFRALTIDWKSPNPLGRLTEEMRLKVRAIALSGTYKAGG